MDQRDEPWLASRLVTGHHSLKIGRRVPDLLTTSSPYSFAVVASNITLAPSGEQTPTTR